LDDSDKVVGTYVCPDGYVSRVIYFSVNPDIDWFKGFLTTQVGEEMVKDRDIRPATRHGWELGNEALIEIGDGIPRGRIMEIYWTIYPKTDNEKNRGVFLDAERKKLFVQKLKRSE
jgi:hypothetical protein